MRSWRMFTKLKLFVRASMTATSQAAIKAHCMTTGLYGEAFKTTVDDGAPVALVLVEPWAGIEVAKGAFSVVN